MTSSPKDPETTTVVQSHDISSAKDSPLTNSTNKTSSVVAATTIGSDGEDDTSTDSSQEDEVPQSTVQSYPTRCNPSPQVYLPTVATQLASAGFIQDAIDVFTEWIEMKAEPEDYRVYFNRCWCRYELEQYKEALDDANKVLHLNTTFSKGYYLKGKIMIEMKRFVEAETAFMTSYSLDGYPQGPLGNPTIQWIKKNIYFCLMDDGYDSYVADCIAKDHLSIDEARHFLDMGGFSEIVVQMVKKKSMQKCEEMKKTGKIYPRSWFKLQYNIAPLRKSRHESD
jgi:tetratricopeptide (TPR) repeat protein